MSRQNLRKRVWECAGQLVAEKGYVCPVDLLVKMGRLTPKQVEDWRFRRIPYLERVATGNSAKMNTILLALQEFARSAELKPSLTAYMSWGKGPKQRLRFSKYGSPSVEEMYATHYVRQTKFCDGRGRGSVLGLAGQDFSRYNKNMTYLSQEVGDMAGELRLKTVVEHDGEIHVSGLPYRKGQEVEMRVRAVPRGEEAKTKLTAKKLLASGLVGMWKEREDIEDGTAYARRLREQAQRRTV